MPWAQTFNNPIQQLLGTAKSSYSAGRKCSSAGGCEKLIVCKLDVAMSSTEQ